MPHALGQGQTLTLAYNPARAASIDHEIWSAFFRATQRWGGSDMDLPIWRFQLPLDLPPRKADPAEGLVCLTQNNVRMSNSVITTPRNAKTEGGYRYVNGRPDQVKSTGDHNELIPFKDGLLTNRVAAYKSVRWAGSLWKSKGRAKKDYKQEDWAISWPGSKDKPLTIDFEFGRPRAIRVVRLVASGTMPKVTLLARNMGGSGKFKPVGNLSAASPGKDVVRVGTQVKAKTRVLRLRFAPAASASTGSTQKPGPGIVLSEVEIWAEE